MLPGHSSVYFQVYLNQFNNLTFNTGYFPGLISRIYTVVVYDTLGNTAVAFTNLTTSKQEPILNIAISDSVTGCTGGEGGLQLTAQYVTVPKSFSIDGGVNYISIEWKIHDLSTQYSMCV